VLNMLEIPAGPTVRAWAEIGWPKPRSRASGTAVQGEGPAATILQKLAVQPFDKFGRTPLYDVAVELETRWRIWSAARIYPNVDFTADRLREDGIPTVSFTPVFAIARVSGGWRTQRGSSRTTASSGRTDLTGGEVIGR
jgi:hypothetical protein